MNATKKTAIMFLASINLMTVTAGIITELKIFFGNDVTSIIPITADLSVNQILLFNFLAVITVMMLISIVTTYLVTDIAYSPVEIITNCAGVMLVIPFAVVAFGVFNAIRTPEFADKIFIIVSAVVYFLINIINFGCLFTIKYDT